MAPIDIKKTAIATLKKFDIGTKVCSSALPRASVLVPLFVKNGELHALMTLRSKEVQL